MWLVGVVIRRYIDILIIIINFPYSTCIRSFFGSSILTSLFIFKCFFGLIYYNGRVKISSYLSSISYVATSESCEYIFSYNGSSFDIDTISISWRLVNVSDFFANVIFIAREIMKLIILSVYTCMYIYFLLPVAWCTCIQSDSVHTGHQSWWSEGACVNR